MLHKQCDQLTDDLQIVNWYIEVIEGGFNTRTIMKDFIQAQAEIKQLKEKLRDTKANLQKKLHNTNKNLFETTQKLKALERNVLKPLNQELRIKDHLNQRLLEQQAINANDLKMLHSVIRTPRLCDQFHRAMKQRKLDKEEKKLAAKQDVDTHLFLRHEIEKHKNNEEKFIDNFMTEIDRVQKADQVQPDNLSLPRSNSDSNG